MKIVPGRPCPVRTGSCESFGAPTLGLAGRPHPGRGASHHHDWNHDGSASWRQLRCPLEFQNHRPL